MAATKTGQLDDRPIGAEDELYLEGKITMRNAIMFGTFALAVGLLANGANAEDTSPATTTNTIAATPADSTETATANDARCAVVFLQSLTVMQSAATKDDAKMTAVLAGAMYWLGRLDGRTPNLDLEQRLMAEETKMTPEIRQAEANRCGNELTARGEEMIVMGNDMTRQGK